MPETHPFTIKNHEELVTLPYDSKTLFFATPQRTADFSGAAPQRGYVFRPLMIAHADTVKYIFLAHFYSSNVEHGLQVEYLNISHFSFYYVSGDLARVYPTLGGLLAH